MRSITYWNRLEPRPRSNDLAGALAARVRDPAWFLARQWQFGEFAGEDAGSPAYVRIAADVAPMLGWQAGDGPAVPLADGVPLERAMLAEPFSPDDLALWVELGNLLDFQLDVRGALDLRGHWLAAFPIGDAPADRPDDARAARLRLLWKGRVVDGLAVYRASLLPPQTGQAPPGVPATVPAARWAQAGQAVQALRVSVEQYFLRGEISAGDPASWQPERLEHSVRGFTGKPIASGTVTAAALDVVPDREGDVEWFAFDASPAAVPAGLPAPTVTTIQRSVIPGPVRFRGMPNERFWDFEDARIDVGAMRLDRRDLTSMVLMEFMLVAGNDWFLVPFEQPLGTLCRSTLTVVDVFGVTTPVPRTEDVPAPPGARPWTMFTVSGLGNGHLLPASAAALVQDGAPIEEVRFLRDETANLVWGIEHATEGALGAARPGHERAAAQPADETITALAPLRYRIQTRVPPHWIPFQSVALPPLTSGQMALELAALLDAGGDPGAPHVAPRPAGKILRPAALAATGAPYRLREEEVPREGTQVRRLARWTRTPDGDGHLWITRTRRVGAGEGWSGLRFDLAQSVDQVVEPPAVEPGTTLIWNQPPGWNGANWQ